MSPSLTPGRVALRAKIVPDLARGPSDRSSSLGWEAEADGFAGSKVEADNEAWHDLRRNLGVPGT